MEDSDESVYKVPLSSHQIDSKDIQQMEEAPPTLMPKKPNSFRISSVGLDRRAPSKMPKPAPRLVSMRKSSVDSLSDEMKDRAKHLRNSSIDLGDMNDTDNSDVFKIKPLPQARARESPNPISNDNLGAVNPTPRPVPRPRARIQSKVQEPSTSPAKIQEDEQLFPASFLGLTSKRDITVQNKTENKFHSEAPEISDPMIPYSIPPDADSLEMLFTKEVNDKFGFSDNISGSCNLSTQSKDDEIPCHIEKEDLPEAGNADSKNHINFQSFSKLEEEASPETSRADAMNFRSGPLSVENSEQLSYHSLSKLMPAFPAPSNIISKTTSEATNLSFIDLFDLDPLWKLKPEGVNENQILTKKDNSQIQQTTSNTHEKTFADSVPSDNCPQFPQPPKPHFVAKPVEIQPASGASGWQEPLTPPPPLPNIVKLARPPPLPPRPSNSPTPPPHLPINIDMANEGNLSKSPSESDNIFDALPTPVFSPTSSNGDPFAGSSFGEYCDHFNAKAVVGATQPVADSVTMSPPLPTPPSPSTKPKAWAVEGTTCKGGRDPSEDPDRISRFVPPPPGAHIGASN